MGIIGRLTARQRLRRATEQSLLVPAFSTPANSTALMIGGLWPAALNTPDPEVARLARYLMRDLQRIADSADDKLRVLSKRDLSDEDRESEEARVINTARAYAVRRVDSTMRQLPTARRRTEGESLEKAPLPGRHAQRRSRDDTQVIMLDQPRGAHRATAATADKPDVSAAMAVASR